MLLVTTTVGDYDRFLNTFSTKGLEKRKQYGCQGSTVFRDPSDASRMLVIFDWDAAGWQSFVSDPDVPAIFQEAGLGGPPQAVEIAAQYDA